MISHCVAREGKQTVHVPYTTGQGLARCNTEESVISCSQACKQQPQRNKTAGLNLGALYSLRMGAGGFACIHACLTILCTLMRGRQTDTQTDRRRGLYCSQPNRAMMLSLSLCRYAMLLCCGDLELRIAPLAFLLGPCPCATGTYYRRSCAVAVTRRDVAVLLLQKFCGKVRDLQGKASRVEAIKQMVRSIDEIVIKLVTVACVSEVRRE